MPKSLTYRDAVLDALLGSGSPATIYIGLFTAAPSSDGTGGTEVAGGSYARVAITNNATNFPAASAGAKSNANAADFASASADWGTIVAAVVFDASSGGNRYYFGNLTTARTVLNGDQFGFSATQLVFTES